MTVGDRGARLSRAPPVEARLEAVRTPMMSARLVSSVIWQAFHRRSRGAERNALERIFEPAWRGGKSEQSYNFAGTLLAKLDDNALPIEADQERIWTLLAVACGEKISRAVLGSLRRVAKHWQGGDKSLAAIHLAQTGLPDIGESDDGHPLHLPINSPKKSLMRSKR
jgi:hypothetical protein